MHDATLVVRAGSMGRLLLVLLCAWPAAARAQQAIEPLRGVTITRREVRNPAGFVQRVIVTAPAGPVRARPTVFVVGWLSCYPVQIPSGGPGGDAALAMLQRVIEESGMSVVRVEKPGQPGSGGKCEETDFDAELSGYRAAFAALASYPEVDTSRIVILGSSNGGGFAPLVAEGRRVRAYVSVGGWARTWIEHMIGLERRRLVLRETPVDSIGSLMRRWIRFHSLYLNERLSPEGVVARDPSLAGLWYDDADRQYGRPLAFYHQLNALDLAAAWSRVQAPVLTVRGEFDWIMSAEDVAPIVATAGPDAAERTLVTVPHAGHALAVYPSERAAFRGNDGQVRAAAFDSILGFLRTRF